MNRSDVWNAENQENSQGETSGSEAKGPAEASIVGIEASVADGNKQEDVTDMKGGECK